MLERRHQQLIEIQSSVEECCTISSCTMSLFTGVHDFLNEKKDHELGVTPSTVDNVNVGKLQQYNN